MTETSSSRRSIQRAAGWWKANNTADGEYIPELRTERKTGFPVGCDGVADVTPAETVSAQSLRPTV